MTNFGNDATLGRFDQHQALDDAAGVVSTTVAELLS